VKTNDFIIQLNKQFMVIQFVSNSHFR